MSHSPHPTQPMEMRPQVKLQILLANCAAQSFHPNEGEKNQFAMSPAQELLHLAHRLNRSLLLPPNKQMLALAQSHPPSRQCEKLTIASCIAPCSQILYIIGDLCNAPH